jgi:ribosome-binding factor A
MRKQRLLGIEKQMTRIISNALFMEVKNPKISGMVSVTKIEVTQDLRYADVYFSVLSVGENKVDEQVVLEGLNEVRKFLRKRVAEETNLRYVPEIRVHLDDTVARAIKISNLIDKVNN